MQEWGRRGPQGQPGTVTPKSVASSGHRRRSPLALGERSQGSWTAPRLDAGWHSGQPPERVSLTVEFSKINSSEIKAEGISETVHR